MEDKKAEFEKNYNKVSIRWLYYSFSNKGKEYYSCDSNYNVTSLGKFMGFVNPYNYKDHRDNALYLNPKNYKKIRDKIPDDKPYDDFGNMLHEYDDDDVDFRRVIKAAHFHINNPADIDIDNIDEIDKREGIDSFESIDSHVYSRMK